MAQYYNYRSSSHLGLGDTTLTKVFVGGLAWETPTEELHKYFQQFGDILEAVIITDKNTGKSKGYGFVTFSDEESATRACVDPNPVIDGRRANCNIASLGRNSTTATRPSPPSGGGGGGGGRPTPVVYGGGVPSPGGLPHTPSLLYPASYGYPTYTPDYGYHQATLYNNQQLHQAQYYQNIYGTSTSSIMGTPYYYGYSMQAQGRTFSFPQQNQLSAGAAGVPPYLYYPTMPIDVSFSGFRPPQQQPAITQSFPSPSDSQTKQRNSSASTAGVVRTSESSNSKEKD